MANKMAARFLLLFVSFGLCLLCVHSSVLCESGFCATFRRENTCFPAATQCSIQNATHHGLTLPSPTLCNCCDFCLPLFNEGHHCSLGGPGDGITIGRCGHGLTCDNTSRTCVRMTSKCHSLQDEYDARHTDGATSVLESRPRCDDRGNFDTFYCVPSQTCFCQSEEGEKLFGEVRYTGNFQNMPCGCSRMFHKIEKYIAPDVPYPIAGLRCTSDGNFNPVQCIERTCYCVNKITGEASGTKRINLDTQRPSELPCYEPDLDLFPIRNDTVPPYEYTTPCFESVKERQKLIEQSKKEGYNVDFFSTFNSISCMPDGTFGRITFNSNGSKICVNERGLQIDNYSAEPGTPEFNNMNCKCALTALLLAGSTEVPRCCSNGNYRPIQCRRGICRCVDTAGRQVGAESNDVTRLSCYTQNWRNC